jgi:hypothetical protein
MMLPRPDPDVAFQRVGDDLVLVHLKTNEIFALNTTAARFWELLTEHTAREHVEAVLLAEFDVSPEQLRTEIDGLLAELSRQKMIRAPE